MTEGLFYNIYARPTRTQEREKMKPIFSTEQARYQKFASFFIVALKEFRVLRNAGISLSAESDKGYAPLTAPPFEKGGRKLSRLGSAVDFVQPSPLAQLLMFIRCRPWLSCLCSLSRCPWLSR